MVQMTDPTKNTPAQKQMLEAIIEKPRMVVSEKAFKMRYLPIIANVNGKYKEIETYIAEVAKSYDTEVEVLNDKGETVAVIPPIRLPYLTEIGYKNSDAIASLVDQVEHTRALSPRAAEKLLGEMLPARHAYQMSADVVKQFRRTVMEQWDALFVKYGLPPRFFKDAAKKVVAPSDVVVQELSDDDFEAL